MSQVNDVGVRLIFTIVEDEVALNISAATTKTIYLKSPATDVAASGYPASFLLGGSGGQIYYDVGSGVLNTAGMWQAQGFVAISGGEYYTDIHKFRVDCNLV